MQKQSPEKFCKKAVLKNFAIFTRKHLCWRLLFIQNVVEFFRAPIFFILKNNFLYFEEHLRTAAFESAHETQEKYKSLIKDFNSSSETSENLYLFVSLSWLVSFGVYIYMQYFFDVVRHELQTINICARNNKKKIKSSRKEHVIRMCFNYWPMKNMRVWLWLVYKFTENYCRLRLFSEFIQTQKGYPTSLDKKNHLSYQAKIFLVNKTPRDLTLCKISHICRCDFNWLRKHVEKIRSSQDFILTNSCTESSFPCEYR